MWNARSIVNELRLFQSFVYSSSALVFAITESWLSPSIYDNEILPHCFTVYRRDRDSRGGGVLSDKISSKLVHSHDSLELLTVDILTSPIITLCLVYRPPNMSETSDLLLRSYIEDLSDRDNVFILGDFNFPEIDWCSLTAVSPASALFTGVLFYSFQG